MTGSSETPRAQRRAPFFNSYLLGPLSRMVMGGKPSVTTDAPIMAIWRNEQGPVPASDGQTGA